MWSLSVEVAFYLALPFLALLARQLPVRARIPTILVVAAASLLWVHIPFDPASGHNLWNWPPAFFSWFAAGMVLAELTVTPVGWPHRLARRRVLMALVALLAFAIAASPLAGREGLQPANIAQVTLKTVMGAVVAAALIAPLVLDRPDTRHRLLGTTTMVTLGRWSYGLFVWHLAALAMVFPVIGEFAFNGHMPVVVVRTVGCGFGIGAVRYAVAESPWRKVLRRWARRNEPTPRDSSGTGGPEPAVALWWARAGRRRLAGMRGTPRPSWTAR